MQEMNRFEKAFKDPEFLKLFSNYVEEMSDPVVSSWADAARLLPAAGPPTTAKTLCRLWPVPQAKAEADAYLRQLEEQGRGEEVYGKGVQLIAPEPAAVLKSKVLAGSPAAQPGVPRPPPADGQPASLPVGQKVFINVCTCDKVADYSLTEEKDEAGRPRKKLSIPLTLGPMRTGTDKQGQPAAVYDFVVAPASWAFAVSNPPAMASLADTVGRERVRTAPAPRGHRCPRLRAAQGQGAKRRPRALRPCRSARRRWSTWSACRAAA